MSMSLPRLPWRASGPWWSRRRWAARAALAVLALASAGCARQARLASVWRDPAFEGGSLGKLMVVAVGRTPRERRLFEDELAAALGAKGVDAVPSYPYVGDEKVDSARVDAEMHRMGCDGILVSRVVDRQTVQRYYPPTPVGYGYGYYGAYGLPYAYRYGGWWPYYSLGYAYAATPGYTVTNQRVSVEANLYRYADGRLVWSGLSRQWLGESDVPGAEIRPVVRELTAELIRAGVARASAQPVASGGGLRPGR